MEITQIRVNRTPEGGRMKAIVSLIFDNQLAVHDIKVIDGPGRTFLAMPSRKMPDGSFRDMVHPINAGTRAMLENFILEKYQQACAEAAQEASEPSGGPEAAGAHASV